MKKFKNYIFIQTFKNTNTTICNGHGKQIYKCRYKVQQKKRAQDLLAKAIFTLNFIPFVQFSSSSLNSRRIKQ